MGTTKRQLVGWAGNAVGKSLAAAGLACVGACDRVLGIETTELAADAGSCEEEPAAADADTLGLGWWSGCLDGQGCFSSAPATPGAVVAVDTRPVPGCE